MLKLALLGFGFWALFSLGKKNWHSRQNISRAYTAKKNRRLLWEKLYSCLKTQSFDSVKAQEILRKLIHAEKEFAETHSQIDCEPGIAMLIDLLRRPA